MEAIVLAGGFGTRLAHVVFDVPKPMASVCGKPFLSYLLSDLAKKGVRHAVLAVGYKRECIETFFGDSFAGMRLTYSVEHEPLLTGGAIRQALECCGEERVFVVNGDTFFDVDLSQMLRAHVEKRAALTVATKLMLRFDRYGTVETDGDARIRAFREKAYCERGHINGGIYCMERSALSAMSETKFSFEKAYMEKFVDREPMYAFASDGYFIDIGVPEDYERAQKEFVSLEKSSVF